MMLRLIPKKHSTYITSSHYTYQPNNYDILQITPFLSTKKRGVSLFFLYNQNIYVRYKPLTPPTAMASPTEIIRPNKTLAKSFRIIGKTILNAFPCSLKCESASSLPAKSHTNTQVVDIGILLSSLK